MQLITVTAPNWDIAMGLLPGLPFSHFGLQLGRKVMILTPKP